MLKLFKTEIKKFRYNATTMLLLSLFTLAFPFVIFTGIPILKNAPKELSLQNIFEFPNVWDFQGYVGSWLVFSLLGFLVIHLVTSENRYKTMRQNILMGYTKREYYVAKLFSILIISLYATLLYIVSTVLIGMAYTKGFNFDLLVDSNWAPVRFFISTFGTLSFAFLCALIMKRSGLTIFFYFTYILLLEPIIRSVLLFKFKTPIANYLPLNILEDNMLFPLHRLASNFINIQKDIGIEYILSLKTAGILGFFVMTIFIGLSWLRFSRDDL